MNDDAVREAVRRSAIASGLTPSPVSPDHWVAVRTFLSQLQRHGYKIVTIETTIKGEQ